MYIFFTEKGKQIKREKKGAKETS